jgi:hypothetical protein
VIDDVSEEHYGLLEASVHDGSSFDPLRELVDHYEVCEAPERLSELPHHVEVPHSKMPCDGDGLKHLRQEVSLSGVELRPLTTTHDVLGVCHRGPVETLSESLSNKSPRVGMVSARAGMDLAKQFLTLIYTRMHRMSMPDTPRL